MYDSYIYSEEELHNQEITEETSPYERLIFIDPLIEDANNGQIIPKINKQELFSAMALIDSISEDIDVLNDLPIYAQNEDQRKWVLLGCSIGLLLDGKEANRENILTLADALQNFASNTGIKFVYPRHCKWEGVRRGNSIATISFISALISKQGVDKVSQMHKEFTLTFKENFSQVETDAISEIPVIGIDEATPPTNRKQVSPQTSLNRAEKKLLLDYEAASLYVSENDPEFAGAVSARVFGFVERRGDPDYPPPGWDLLLTINQLPFNPTDQEIAEAVQKSYQDLDSIMLPNRPAFRMLIDSALRTEQWNGQ